MPNVIRSILGVVAGLVLAFVVISAIEYCGHLIYPLPPGVDATNLESLKAAMANVPTGALLFVLGAWALGSFLGGWLAAFIARFGHVAHALMVGGVLMLMAIVNLLLFPHPVWFWVLSFVVILPVACLGGRIAAGRQPSVTA
jgi:hypothetical protein